MEPAKDLFILLMVLIFPISSCSSNQKIIRDNFKNQELGEELVYAITQYQLDFQEFPPSLEDLKPEYLKSIPKTISRTEFEYFLSDIDGYILCFDKNQKFPRGCCYLYSFSTWDCSAGKVP